MQLLLVEDDDNKIDALRVFLDSYNHVFDVLVEKSLVKGLRCAKKIDPGLILLDMTLPNYDGPTNTSTNKMRAFGGVEFVRQASRLGLSGKIIVITQFESFGDPPNVTSLEDVDQDLRTRFPQNYLGAVYYHATQSRWERLLDAMINEYREQNK